MFMEFELGHWGDGTTRLYHQDSLRGEDIVIILDDDGTAILEKYTEDGEVQERVENLGHLLLSALEERYERDKNLQDELKREG